MTITIIKTYKIRLNPTSLQESLMFQSAGTSRWAYNYALGRRIEYYKETGQTLPEGEIRKEITQLKKTEEYAWLNNVSAQIPKQAVKDCDSAYKRFFKKQSDFPKFKSKKKSKTSFYNDNVKFKVKNNSTVNIEKVGWVATSEQLPLADKYSNPRIGYDHKYWYITVGVEEVVELGQLTTESLGIDLGIKDLAIVSNGKVYKNINKSKEIKRLKKKLKRLEKKTSRKYTTNNKKLKGGENRYQKSNNIIKIEKEKQLIYRRLTNIRNNHIHQATSEIIKSKPRRIVMEDLNIKGMMKNKNLSKAIQEQKFYEFRRQIEYKCKWNGIEFVLANRFFPSSKLCSECGCINKNLKLSDRTYKCDCGFELDRDLNASINLSKY